ncbi:short-chain fatty acyl-CoA regulator family protein [Catenuloplanes japonicus]|uniref:short-chain fatty acyl-CoA regulator family protein n=1 Tax=Catenuloplanes japonicus TaxID=33876 RepID=UPI0005268149|nr:short-chain fatty acyl-CoA regulator family protein [Catenuloplanes japonicus]
MEKTYAGRRLRRLREERRISQADMARRLAISASYLNQIEHDSRPLTVAVLLRLSEEFGVDPGFFATNDTSRRIAELREVFADQGLTPPSAAEAAELAEQHPHAAALLVDLHHRHREASLRLTELTGDPEPAPPGAAVPHEEVRDYFYDRQNHIAELDEPAERLAAEIDGDLTGRLARHGITVATGVSDAGDLHRYDPRTRTLHLAAHLRPGQRQFRMAAQIAYAEHWPLITTLADEARLATPESTTLARIGLASYFAAALLMPYRQFHAAAEECRYDVERLGARYGLGFETICHRLSTMQRPRLRGVPFSFIRVDRAGNMSKRQSATGFHFSRTGGTCPLWNVYEAFASPGRVLTQIAVMPDGRRYLWIARSVTRTPGRYGAPGKTFAVGLGCDLRHAGRLVYSTGLDLDDTAAVPIGAGCRVCERSGCPQRAFPQTGRQLAISENRSAFTPYPLA